jgi:HSP20 family protein
MGFALTMPGPMSGAAGIPPFLGLGALGGGVAGAQGGQAGGFGSAAGRQARELQAMPPVPRAPPLDLVDVGQEFLLQVELPGAKKDDLDIMVSDRAVTVSAQVKPEIDEGTLLLAERVPTLYRRVVQLPNEVNTTGTKATFKDGLLRLRIPKKEPTDGPKRVDVAYG